MSCHLQTHRTIFGVISLLIMDFLKVFAHLFLIIILCCWLSRCFCYEIFHKKLSLVNASFTTQPLTNHDRWKLIQNQNFKGYNFYQINFWGFALESWEILSFVPAKKNYFTCNSLKRDRVALVGLPPAALGPQDIPHQRTARPELVGALFRYINS